MTNVYGTDVICHGLFCLNKLGSKKKKTNWTYWYLFRSSRNKHLLFAEGSSAFTEGGKSSTVAFKRSVAEVEERPMHQYCQPSVPEPFFLFRLGIRASGSHRPGFSLPASLQTSQGPHQSRQHTSILIQGPTCRGSGLVF